MARQSLDIGLQHEIRVLGLASIAPDVLPDLGQATIACVALLGALPASAETGAAAR